MHIQVVSVFFSITSNIAINVFGNMFAIFIKKLFSWDKLLEVELQDINHVFLWHLIHIAK